MKKPLFALVLAMIVLFGASVGLRNVAKENAAKAHLEMMRMCSSCARFWAVFFSMAEEPSSTAAASRVVPSGRKIDCFIWLHLPDWYRSVWARYSGQWSRRRRS